MHAESRNLLGTPGAWIHPFLEADLLPMQTLCHTLIYFDNFHQFEYVWIGQDICQDRSGFYPPKSQPDLPRLAQALQTNISLADLWLRGMAIGAASSGRTVQWPWLNLLPSPIRSCSSTSVGNWLLNIYEPWVHDHFMTSQGIACPIHTMSSPQLPIQQSQMLEQQVGYGGRGSIGSVDPSFFMTHGFTGDYIDRDTQWAIGATQHGPQADCLAWKNRFDE